MKRLVSTRIVHWEDAPVDVVDAAVLTAIEILIKELLDDGAAWNNLHVEVQTHPQGYMVIARGTRP